LSQEEENKEKRKKESLSTNEWLRCFFLSSLVYMNNDNDPEQKRFERYGFERKIKQSVGIKVFGGMFYGLVILIIVLLFK